MYLMTKYLTGEFIMLKAIKKLFGLDKPAAAPEAPYKVETPVAEPTPVAVQATEAMVESVVPAKKPAAKKTAAKKAPAAKKPRAPKAPK
jgi:predicted amidohydrolase YtcJ